MAEKKPEQQTPEQSSGQTDDAPRTEAEEGSEKLSRDAAHSTYRRYDVQREGEIIPPPGPQTQQELGKPSEGGGTVFTAKRAGRE